MKVPAAILAVLATALAVTASNPHNIRSLASRHARLAPRAPTLVNKPLRKRCKPRPTGLNDNVRLELGFSSSPVSSREFATGCYTYLLSI